MDKFKTFSIQKFDGTNFQLWKYQMEIVFRAENLLDFVEGKKKYEEKDKKEFQDVNARAMLFISTSMEFKELQTIMTCKTADEMWTRLKIIHEQKSSINKVTLKQQFFNYRMNETDGVAKHVSKN